MRPAKGLRVLTSVGIAAVLWSGVAAHAGSARDYLNAPVDTWLLNYNAGYTTSVTPEDGTDTVPGVRSNVFAQSVVLTRIMDYWGRDRRLLARSALCAHRHERRPISRQHEWRFRCRLPLADEHFWRPGADARAVPILHSANVLELSFLVTTPLGAYNPTSPINPSANRWMISPTVNFSYTPDQGWTWIETYVSGRIFTDNGNYLVNGAQTLTQRPLLRLEEHLSRNVTDALWLSADAYYNLGGETSIDGIDQDNMANTLRIGAGMGLRLWRGADMGLNYERVVAKPASEPYSQTVRLTVRQLW